MSSNGDIAGRPMPSAKLDGLRSNGKGQRHVSVKLISISNDKRGARHKKMILVRVMTLDTSKTAVDVTRRDKSNDD